MITRRVFLAGASALASSAILVPAATATATATAAGVGRVLSVGGGVTETVFALGESGRLVAVDTTSLFPLEAMQLPQVGYLRQLSAEGVLAQAPDLVLASEDAGPAAALTQIRTAGVEVVTIVTPRDAAGISANVRAIGAALGVPGKGAALAERIDADFAALRVALQAITDRPRALFVMSAGQGPLLAAGDDTAAALMMQLSGLDNAVEGFTRYKPLAAEILLANEPDFIVVPSHAADAIGGVEGLKAIPALAQVRAAQAGRIAVLDSLYLLGLGPRAPQAAADLAELARPGVQLPGLGRIASPSSFVLHRPAA